MNSLNKTILTFLSFHEKNIFYKIFFTNSLYDNHVYIYLYYNIFQLLHFWRYSIYNSFISLIDLIGVDVTGLKNYNFITQIMTSSFKKPFNFLLIYNFIDYNLYYRYIWNNLIVRENIFFTLTNLYSNTNWLERELIEFFGISIIDKVDTRNLLLDYNFIWNPLLKSFPVEGFQEIYYNFNTHTLDYASTEFIEL